MSRLLPPPHRDHLAEHELETFDRVAARFGSAARVGFFGALLHSPPICDAINDGSLAFREAERRGTLTTEHREWIDIVVGHELGSPWLIIAHLPAATGAGIDAHMIQAVCDGRDDLLDTQLQRLVRFVRAIVRGTMTDELFNSLKDDLGERRIVELTAFSCWVTMNTRLAQALGQPENSSAELAAAINRLIEP